MDKNDSIAPQKKKDKNQSVIIISLLVTAVFLIVDLYVMINMPKNLAALIIITALFLSSVYFFINAVLQEMKKSRLRAEEQCEIVIKSGKASYLLMKKVFAQIDDKNDKNDVEVNPANPSEDVIAAQKALAKVIINRNKENADAVMNSNDKVFEKIFELENRMEMHQNDLLDLQRSMMNDCVKEMMQAQQEVISNIKEIGVSVKNELLDTLSSIQTMLDQQAVSIQQLKIAENSHTVETSSFEEPLVPENSDVDRSSTTEEFNLGETSLVDDFDFGETGITEDFDLGETEGTEDFDFGEPSLTENLDFGETGITEDFDLGETEGTEDFDFGENSSLGETTVVEEISSLLEELNLNDKGDVKESATSTLQTPDFDFEMDQLLKELKIDESLSEEPEPEEIAEPETEPVIETIKESEPKEIAEPETEPVIETIEEPEPEEIVVPETEPVIESVEEPKETAEPEPVSQEMPNLSDPHKLMTPEEIAALIANM